MLNLSYALWPNYGPFQFVFQYSNPYVELPYKLIPLIQKMGYLGISMISTDHFYNRHRASAVCRVLQCKSIIMNRFPTRWWSFDKRTSCIYVKNDVVMNE